MYRIKTVKHYRGVYFVLQKRLFGVLWWYNPDNIDAMTTGVYETLEDALDSYNQKMHKTTINHEYLD